MRKTVSAGIIIFRHTESGIKYLLLYKGKNYWNFPKGKIEMGERSYETALREIKEETGLEAQDLKMQSNFKAFERFVFQHQKEKIFRVVILYLAETKNPRVFISPEHEGYGWFTVAEAKKILTKHPDTFRILQRAHSFLKNGYFKKPPAEAHHATLRKP
jgi:8-oxo-dGTP pyrophosphatase MutT (NUDIX family)